ncbi:MAG: hypothetical protein ACRYFU_12080, partial [Janthinobacterium lividum]
TTSATPKIAGVSERIEACGARVLYLLPYSPDLKPSKKPGPSSRQTERDQGQNRQPPHRHRQHPPHLLGPERNPLAHTLLRKLQLKA